MILSSCVKNNKEFAGVVVGPAHLLKKINKYF